jgi:hypothetical protein
MSSLNPEASSINKNKKKQCRKNDPAFLKNKKNLFCGAMQAV